MPIGCPGWTYVHAYSSVSSSHLIGSGFWQWEFVLWFHLVSPMHAVWVYPVSGHVECMCLLLPWGFSMHVDLNRSIVIM